MNEEMGLRLLVEWEDPTGRVRSRESALGALILHLAVVIMVLISPRGAAGYSAWFGAQPVSIVQLVPVPLAQPPLYVPPGVLAVPEENTPSDLTEEERRRAVIRTPGGETPRPDQPFSLPTPPAEESGGGDRAAAPSLTPGSDGDTETNAGETSPVEAGTESAENGPEIALLDIPRPGEDKSGVGEFLPKQSPGQMLEESIRRSRKGADGGFVGPGPGEGVRDPNLNTPFPTILSDTRGVDFGPYLVRVLNAVRLNWYAVIPESARRLGERGRVVIVFSILKNGDVPSGEPTVVASSERSHLDRPALAAIRGANPFPPLPSAFTGDKLVLQFTFLYNMSADELGR